MIEKKIQLHSTNGFPRLWGNGLGIREFLYQLAEQLKKAPCVLSQERAYDSSGVLWPAPPENREEHASHGKLQEDIPEGTYIVQLSVTLCKQIADDLTAIAEALEL